MEPISHTPAADVPGLGRRSIRVQLAVLVLVAILPLFLLSIWQSVQGRDRDRAQALERVDLVLDGTLNRLHSSLADYAGTLALIASQPLIRSMDVTTCDPLIKGFVRMNPEFVTIGTRDLQGNAMCTYRKDPPGRQQMLGFSWFLPATTAGRFEASDAFMAPLARRWVSMLTEPIRNDQDQLVGIVALPLDLNAFNALIMRDVRDLRAGALVLVLDKQRRVLLRSTEPEKWVARSVVDAFPSWNTDVGVGAAGVSTLTDAQGVRQIVSHRTLAPFGWTVASTMPEAAVYADADWHLARSAAISVVLLALALALAWRMARGIVRPIEGMAAAAAGMARGALEARVPAMGGAPELVALEQAFNQMVQARHTVEVALRENERNLAITLQSIGDAVIATDIGGRITRMNPAAERLTGWPLGDALAQPVTDVFRIASADGLQATKNPVHSVLETGDVVGLSNGTVLLTRDGTRLRIADSAAPIQDIDGTLVGVVVVFSDVTAQYVAQRELRESFNFVRQIIDNLPLGLNVMDAQGRYLEWNPAMEAMRGRSKAEMIGLTVADTYPRQPEALYDEVMDAVTRAMQGELVERPDRPIVGTNPLIWTTIRHAPVRNSQGTVVGSLSIVQDVTARKLAEESLRLSEESLAITLRSIGDAVLATDMNGVITRMNPTAERLTGWTLEEARGQPLAAVFRVVNAHTRETPLNPVAQVLASGQVVGLANHTALIARGGRQYQIYDSAAPIRDAQDHMVGVVLVFSDVTEQYRLQQGLVESEQRYRALVQSSPVGVIVHIDEKFVFVNPAAARMLGAHDAAELVGRPIRDFVHSRMHDVIDARLEQMDMDLSKGAATTFPSQDWRYVRLDGSQFDIQAQASMIQLGGQTAVQVSFTDITERKRTQDQLRDNEARFRALTSLSSDWYWEQDADFRFVQFRDDGTEPASRNFLGANFVGKRRWEMGDTQLTQAQWDQHRAILQAHREFREFEVRYEADDGDFRWASVSGMPIFDDRGDFTGYRGIGRDITEHKKTQEQINSLAFYDALTELPNRRLLIEQLKRALLTHARNQRLAALLFIDLDNFKTLNDTQGHETGDLLLQQVAQRLLGCVREADSVARLGGDEFVVMLPDLSADALDAATHAEQVGHKILDAFVPAFVLAGREYRSTPSIGITLFGHGSRGVEELLKQADLAMYQAKAAGRNTLRMFDQGMQAAVEARVAMESDLRAAIRQSQFVLHYQAVVGRTGRVSGAEALIRWRHPTRGQVSPGQFIPLAEATGLIVPLGHWVLDQACAQLAAWDASTDKRHLTLAVNVSAHQFKAPDFVELVFKALELHGANPERLKLELTESLLADNVEDVVEKMTSLRARGVVFSLDDFGTGYSSLSYLKRLPLAHLKIDQSFVRDLLVDPNDEAIARTIVALGASLGLAVIAEGVETEGQLALLKAMGCETFQGYLFARPVPINEFEALVAFALPLPQ